MARFLFFSAPIEGHSASPLAIMRRLVETGHDVTWLAGRAYADRAAAAGVNHLPFVHTIDYSGQDPFDFFPALRGLSGVGLIRAAFRDMFIPSALDEVVDLEAAITRVGADVIVSSGPIWGPRLVGERLGLPVATIGDGAYAPEDPDIPPFGPGLRPWPGWAGRMRNRVVRSAARRLFADCDASLREVRRALDLPAAHDGAFAFESTDLHLQGSVPEFEYPMAQIPPHVRFVGALRPMAPAGWVPPPWWSDLDGSRPVVHLTQGTIRADGDELIRPTLDALADEDVLVVTTTGAADPDAIGPLPANARAARFIPYDELLPRADVFVTNGGFIGITLAVHHGVPIVQIGNTEEKAENGGRVAHAGLGVALKRRPTGEALNRTILDTMTDERIAARVRAVSTAFRRHDAPVEAAGLLVDLATTSARRRKPRVALSMG